MLFLTALVCKWSAWLAFIVYTFWWWFGSPSRARLLLFAASLLLWVTGWVIERVWNFVEARKAVNGERII